LRYIEIQDGQSIAIDKIEAIKRIDDFRSNIYTHYNIYEANFPYTVLIEILESEGENPINKKLDAFLSEAGHFAG